MCTPFRALCKGLHPSQRRDVVHAGQVAPCFQVKYVSDTSQRGRLCWRRRLRVVCVSLRTLGAGGMLTMLGRHRWAQPDSGGWQADPGAGLWLLDHVPRRFGSRSVLQTLWARARSTAPRRGEFIGGGGPGITYLLVRPAALYADMWGVRTSCSGACGHVLLPTFSAQRGPYERRNERRTRDISGCVPCDLPGL